ncbi:Glucose-6-phosphate isomerase [Tepidimonas sediminis]|uniref:Glucose-6-phosphate isomerase n=1 Tax=Tepidimonas sediminis TaxID=2588941 RepID=A0A554WQU6_9BURK|nr:glucose-6-phosphate isomerase [Tepidimonas sediminis]TSE25949.1 Glucose-6-phosphate isomerase [Tepidimonas sediminis]
MIDATADHAVSATAAAFVPPPRRAAWRRLQALAAAPQPHLWQRLAAQDQARTRALTFEAAGLTLDATHQALGLTEWEALLALAAESRVAEQAEALRRGAPVNATEGRAALHVALRGSHWADAPWGETINRAVRQELDRMLEAAERLRAGAWPGTGGAPITDVVNLGIGGSDLGPRMAVQALAAHAHPHVRVHFVSNPDAWALHDTLRRLDPGRTLFIVQSKSFTTVETQRLADSCRRWLTDAGVAPERQAPHWIAVTAHPDRAVAWGVPRTQTFVFWDWVGGRYSLWSAIGLPLAVAIGRAGFEQLLAGAHALDRHAWEAPPERNLPLALALLGIWNRNFRGCPTHLLAIYAWRLGEFARHVQQLDMESNGKRVHVDGSPVAVDTGPIVWGGQGLDAQHAYFQLLHQGTHRVAVDFIGVCQDDTPLPAADEHRRLVHANLRAQARALAIGRDPQATAEALRAERLDETEVRRLTPHRTYPGGTPSNLLWLPRLDPFHLGALVAAYEHKVFYQAAIWGIHPFDQWGVELGKTLARTVDNSACP